MRLKLSWDFFCTLSHWELGTSKLLTRVQNDRAARCFWYGEIPILVIQSILLKWISDYWIMLPSIFVGLNLMMKQNHFSSFFYHETQQQFILFPVYMWYHGCVWLSKRRRAPLYTFQSILSSHVFCLGKLVRTSMVELVCLQHVWLLTCTISTHN